MESVKPTGTPGAAARMASTETRWAAASRAATSRESATSVFPGGNMPACHPMVATTLGSLIVHARAITSPSASATTVQNRREVLDGRV